VVNLGIDRPRISDKHWVHFPEKEISFFRISFPHNLSDDVTPPGKSSISAEVSYSAAAPPDDEVIVERVVEDLIRAQALQRDDRIIATATYDIRWGYCIYDMQRAEALRTIHGWLQSVDIIPTGRYGLWRYFWSDESIVSGFDAAAQAKERMAGSMKYG
jgi:UDP-galactopyranose mutase